MHSLANVLVAVVAALHAWFLVLEMFLWTKPIGLRVFHQSREKAEASRVLAANQGLYNGFLSIGLVVGLLAQDPSTSFTFKAYFLGCVALAGIYGGITASRGIFFAQALPGILALAATIASEVASR